jgi:hypothetical protein
MTGPDRARCYALALGTGFRAGELASLTPERFDLDANPPTVTVQGGYTKNGKEAVQPLPPALAERLAPWLATLPSARAVFNLPDRTAEMIRVDLTAAGIEYEMPSGVVDFHALRGCYISYLVSSGASVKTCQTLARHSTPSLTIGIYAKASLHDITEAVGALPDLTPTTREPEDLAATGTDGQIRTQQRAAQGKRAGDGSGRDLSVAGADDDVTIATDEVMSMGRKTRSEVGLGGSCSDLSAPDIIAGGGSRTHMGDAPRGILSPLRLPFRHAGWSTRPESRP